MNQQQLSKWLKIVLLLVGLIAAFIYIIVIPSLGRTFMLLDHTLMHWYYPWLIAISLTGIPFYLALLQVWHIATAIGNDQSFTHQNATRLKTITQLALVDSFYFLGINVVYFILNINHPGILLLSIMITVVGVSIAVVTATVSHLIYKASELEEDSKYTI